MTLFSRKADYALLILSYLHSKGVAGNAREIAERFGLSRSFVANILKELAHKGLVSSTRGVKGGYALQRSTGLVTLAELLEAIGEGFHLTVCNEHMANMNVASCDLAHVCPVKSPLTEIHKRLMVVLNGVTLADVFAPAGNTEPALATLGLLNRSPEPTTTTA
jgi:Rrf2 family protein